MLRSCLKTALASPIYWSGADRLLARGRGLRRWPLVIGYHRVVQDMHASAATGIVPSLISTRTLERHLDWLGRRFSFVTLDEAVSADRRFARPPAAVVFDDGYRDIHDHALPLLRRKGIPAAVFVVTDLVGTGGLLAHDHLYLLLAAGLPAWRAARRHPGTALVQVLARAGVFVRSPQRLRHATNDVFRVLRVLLETLTQAEIERVIEMLAAEIEIPPAAIAAHRLLSWDMLRALARHDFTIGSHTRSHVHLTRETPERVREETAGSRRVAEQQLGRKVEHFAYPDGRFNRSVVRAVAAAGYRCAYTTCQHRDAEFPLLTLPRRVLWENSCVNALGDFSSSMLSCQVNGAFDFVAPCKQDHR